MIELYGFNKLRDSNSSDKTNDYKPNSVVMILVVILYIAILVMAYVRAYNNTIKGPSNSRVTHFMFATISPVMYLLLSFIVPNYYK